MKYVFHTLQKQKWVQVAPQKKKKILATNLYLHKYKEKYINTVKQKH